MSKLTAHDFKASAVLSPDNDPNFKGVKSKYVLPEKLNDKLPKPVLAVFSKEKARGRWPKAWILKLKHKDSKAYAIVSRVNSGFNEVRVLDKHGVTITKEKQTNYDSIDE